MSGQEIAETVAASALLGLQRLIEAIGVASIAGFGVIEAASLADAVARARGVIVEQQAAEEAFIAPEAIAMVGERYKSVDHLARLQAAVGYCGTCLTGPACRCAERAGHTSAPGIDLRQFRPIVQKERTRLANSVDRMRVQLSEGLRPEVRESVQALFNEELLMLGQADDLLALIDQRNAVQGASP